MAKMAPKGEISKVTVVPRTLLEKNPELSVGLA
jgi:hypothetical protein